MAQKSSSEALQLFEVHPGGTEDRIDPVAFGAFQPVTVHAMFLFQVSNARLNRRTAFHPAPETSRRLAAMSLVHMNLNVTFVSVSAIPHVNKGMLRYTGDAFNL